MRTQITVEHSTDSFGSMGDGADVAASIGRFGELLARRIQRSYPAADVDVSWTSNDSVQVIAADRECDDDIRETVEEHIATLYHDFEAWLVMEKPTSLPAYTCLLCGHTWHPRTEERPLRCARCKSPYWNRPHTSRAAEKRAALRAEIAFGHVTRTPASRVIIAAQLDISLPELDALAAGTDGGDNLDANAIADDVTRRLCPDLDPETETIAQALERHGILTAAEADWLADA
jgi:predicted Zn-ribbon and HTH transcriptional regulator